MTAVFGSDGRKLSVVNAVCSKLPDASQAAVGGDLAFFWGYGGQLTATAWCPRFAPALWALTWGYLLAGSSLRGS